MKELVVISGKGGSGKTSVVASLVALADRVGIADCDVDAADLHLVLTPEIEHREDFQAGRKASVVQRDCVGCAQCVQACRFEAISLGGPANDTIGSTYQIDPIDCEGCGVCVRVCPQECITFEPVVCGQWFRSRTRHGPMVHARLGIAQENSGKLVALVRQQAQKWCEQLGLDLVLVDGPPGIGCPVIASITGATLVLAVVEPTLSGLHDLDRALQLAKHFRVPTAVCINKWDICGEMTEQIERQMQAANVPLVGRIRYDDAVTKAQIDRLSVVEYGNSPAAADITAVWSRLRAMIGE